MHPNMELSSNKKDSFADRAQKFGNPYDSVEFDERSSIRTRKKGCFYFFKQLDNRIMRPVFIYKYH